MQQDWPKIVIQQLYNDNVHHWLIILNKHFVNCEENKFSYLIIFHSIFTYHSKIFVPKAHKNPKILKLNSNELHKPRPIVIGTIENFVQWPVLSPNIILLIITVNNGDDDLIVATNETAIYLSATKPKTIVRQRNAPINIISQKIVLIFDGFLWLCAEILFIICICI